MPDDSIVPNAAPSPEERAVEKIRAAITTASSTLDLTSLGLTSLPASLAEAVAVFSHVNLADNSLTTLPTWFGELTNLRVLRLDKNPIKNLPSSIRNLQSLTELYVASAELQSLPEWVGELRDLMMLCVHE